MYKGTHTNTDGRVLNFTFFAFIVFCIVTKYADAQEIHFSQFYANPLTTNPAQTAWYNGNVRVNCMYRDQWRAIDSRPFQTISFSAEKQFHLYDHTYGFGIQALRDESGYVGLEVDKILVSGALALHINGHSLSGGVQLGLVYKNTNALDYTYDQQFDLGGNSVFNRDYETGEIESDPLFHLAINAGVMWSKRLSYNYIAEAGVSLFNLNTPYETLNGVELESTKQNLRTAIQFGGTIELNNRLDIQPKIVYMMQEKATCFLLCALVDYELSESTILYGGPLFRYGWSKNFDASIFTIGTKYKRFDIGLSYDVNVSSLREATNFRGAFEVSVTYLSPSWKSTKVKIPCERI